MSDTITTAGQIDDGKEEVQLELNDETVKYLNTVALRDGLTVDQVVENILLEVIERIKAGHFDPSVESLGGPSVGPSAEAADGASSDTTRK